MANNTTRTILKKKIQFKYILTLKTGLHIGATNCALSIGGVDNAVIRNPIDNKPYIPGSSLKGKMRSLLELKDGSYSSNQGPCNNKNERSAQLFGMAAGSKGGRISRLIVRDAFLLSEEAEFKNLDLQFTELKHENSINRITAEAKPRPIERVPAGAKFEVNMILNVYSCDNEEILKDTLSECIEILENDYLGGGGTRGNGQVEFTVMEGFDGGKQIFPKIPDAQECT